MRSWVADSPRGHSSSDSLAFNPLDVSLLVSSNIALDGKPAIIKALCARRWRRQDYQSLQHYYVGALCIHFFRLLNSNEMSKESQDMLQQQARWCCSDFEWLDDFLCCRVRLKKTLFSGLWDLAGGTLLSTRCVA